MIANELRSKDIPTPKKYFIGKGIFEEKIKENIPFWEIPTIRNILRNQAYCGDVINFKTYRKSYKDHKMYFNAPEDYFIFKGINDPIISEEQYKRAQELLDKKRRVPTVREPDIFQGYLYCADCGKRMSMRRTTYTEAYVCNTYSRNTKACTTHYMRRDVLANVVLLQIRKLIYNAKNTPDVFTQNLQTGLDVKSEKELKKSKSEINRLKKRSAELEKIISKLFEDRALDKISEERYFSMISDFENQLKEIRQKIEECQQILVSSKQNTNLIDNFIKTINKYDDITELNQLNQYVLLDFVDKIVIRQREKNQDYEDVIDIYFNEIGNIFFED